MNPIKKSHLRRYYTRAIIRAGRVIGYGVYDCIGGMESEHGRYMLAEYSVETALHLADTQRDDLNEGVV